MKKKLKKSTFQFLNGQILEIVSIISEVCVHSMNSKQQFQDKQCLSRYVSYLLLFTVNQSKLAMLPKQIVYIISFFDAFGYDSGSSTFSKNRKIVHFICFVHVSLAIVLTIFKFHLNVKYYSSLELPEAFSELLQYSTALYTYWLILMDSIVEQKSHHQFWTILQQIHVEFNNQQNFHCRRYLLKFVEFLSVVMAISIWKIATNPLVEFDVEIAYAILFEICLIRMFYYLFCLEIVQFQLNAIRHEMNSIKTLSDRSNHRKRKFSHSFDASEHLHATKQLKWIRNYVECVYKMTQYLNEIFGYSHVAAILFFLYFVLTELNWIYIHNSEIQPFHRLGIVFFLNINSQLPYFLEIILYSSDGRRYCTLLAVDFLYFPQCNQLPF